MLGIETQIAVLDTAKTAHKQSRNDQQGQRPADLDGDQDIAQTLASTGRSASAFVQYLPQVAMPDAGRRHDDNERRGRRRNCQGIHENVPVEIEIKDDGQLTLQGHGAE